MMGIPPPQPRKTGAEWKIYALKKLHPELKSKDSDDALIVPTEDGKGSRVASGFDLPSEVADTGTQSEFGTIKEATSATIVTTADIQQLIPLPDDAHLTRCTAASLRRAEKDATDLLHHVQREISQQLQEAGVSYATSALDSLESAGQLGEKVEPRAKFAPRRQLEYHGGGAGAQHVSNVSGAETALDEANKLQNSHHANNYYWRYAEQGDELRTHSENFSRRANAMDQVRQSAERRHLLYDDIERQLRAQTEELNKRLTNANELLAKSQEKDLIGGLPVQGYPGAPGRAGQDPNQMDGPGVPTYLTGMLPGVHRVGGQGVAGVAKAPSYSGGTFIDDYMKTGGLGPQYSAGGYSGQPALHSDGLSGLGGGAPSGNTSSQYLQDTRPGSTAAAAPPSYGVPPTSTASAAPGAPPQFDGAPALGGD